MLYLTRTDGPSRERMRPGHRPWLRRSKKRLNGRVRSPAIRAPSYSSMVKMAAFVKGIVTDATPNRLQVRFVAAGASICTWAVCPLVRSACACSSALARQEWIFRQSIPGSSATAAVRRFGGSVRRTLARSRWTRPHHLRRCASASVGITPILGIASSLSFQTGTALKGQPLSVSRGSGLGGW